MWETDLYSDRTAWKGEGILYVVHADCLEAIGVLNWAVGWGSRCPEQKKKNGFNLPQITEYLILKKGWVQVSKYKPSLHSARATGIQVVVY